jgi:methanogenic corrinoid protein MtbC1
MTRLTLSAFATEFEEAAADLAAARLWPDGHRLPFNSDSPRWIQARLERPAAEERMTRLVKTLEAEIIPRLVEAHRCPGAVSDAPVAGPHPTRADVDAFVQLLLRREQPPIAAHVSALRDQGVSIEVLYLQLLAPAARQLGCLWPADECDFTDVTLGLGRLQGLLQEFSPEFSTEAQFPANARRVLLLPAPGEQHTFGLSMVGDFFMHAGWEVTSGQGARRTEAIDMVRREWFDVVGFSVGTEARLDWLTSSIVSVREVSRNKAIGVLVGGPIFTLHPEYAALVGADATSTDGKQAPVAAEKLIACLSKSP